MQSHEERKREVLEKLKKIPPEKRLRLLRLEKLRRMIARDLAAAAESEAEVDAQRPADSSNPAS
jgi:hypothetical protein